LAEETAEFVSATSELNKRDGGMTAPRTVNATNILTKHRQD